MRLASRLPRRASASKSLTSAAKRVAKSAESNTVMGPTPLSPAVSRCQKSSLVFPIGVTAPKPVTTTRRLFKTSLGYGGSRRVPLAKDALDVAPGTRACRPFNGAAGGLRTAADPHVPPRRPGVARRRAGPFADGYAAAARGAARRPASQRRRRDQRAPTLSALVPGTTARPRGRRDVRRRLRRPSSVCGPAPAALPCVGDVLYRYGQHRAARTRHVVRSGGNDARRDGHRRTRRRARRPLGDERGASALPNRHVDPAAARSAARARRFVRVPVGAVEPHDARAGPRGGDGARAYHGPDVRHPAANRAAADPGSRPRGVDAAAVP